MAENPFRPAEQVRPKVKCLVYGPSGVGKTYFGLTAPGKVAVIDTEGGTAFYAGRGGLSEFDVLPTKTFHDVTRAIGYLATHPGEYETLVIDPVTVLYETLQDAAQVKRATVRRNEDADLEMLDWQRIKRAYKALMTDLVNLPLHVIVIAREADLTEERMNGQRKERVKIGVRPDAEKSTPYYFDTVIRLVPVSGGREAVVEKDRTGTIPAGVKAPSFDKLFGKAIKANAGGTAARSLPSDADAAATDAETTFGEDMRTSLPNTSDGGLIGRATTQGTQDFELRQGPDGYVLPFRVKEGRASVIVIAHGELAETLALIRSQVLEQTVTVWGTFSEHPIPGKPVSFQALDLTAILTPDGLLPAREEPTEADSLPLFDAVEDAAIDAMLPPVGSEA